MNGQNWPLMLVAKGFRNVTFLDGEMLQKSSVALGFGRNVIDIRDDYEPEFVIYCPGERASNISVARKLHGFRWRTRSSGFHEECAGGVYPWCHYVLDGAPLSGSLMVKAQCKRLGRQTWMGPPRT